VDQSKTISQHEFVACYARYSGGAGASRDQGKVKLK
jgi:hypothetical protein